MAGTKKNGWKVIKCFSTAPSAPFAVCEILPAALCYLLPVIMRNTEGSDISNSNIRKILIRTPGLRINP